MVLRDRGCLSKLPRCVCCVLLYCFITLTYLGSVDAQDTRQAIMTSSVHVHAFCNGRGKLLQTALCTCVRFISPQRSEYRGKL